jgi:hypothetical protein
VCADCCSIAETRLQVCVSGCNIGPFTCKPLRAATARGCSWLLHKSRECISRPVSRTNPRPSGGLGLPIDRRENMQSLSFVAREARPPQFSCRARPSNAMATRPVPRRASAKPWLRVITSPYPRNTCTNTTEKVLVQLQWLLFAILGALRRREISP